jgi:uncharacterized protein (TIGR02147 family)
MKSVFEYKDHLDFLKDFFQKKKKENPGFSYTVWARKINLKSSSMLSMVLTGERLPSKALIKKIAVYMELSLEEEEYLITLINLKKIVKNPRLTVYLNSDSYKSKSTNSEDLFLSPITFIIKELIDSSPRGGVNANWLKKTLLIQHHKYNLDNVISELIEKEIIAKNENGQLEVVENNILKVIGSSDQIKNFHNATLEISKQAFETSHKDQRTFHTSFVKLKKDRLEEAKRRIQEFQRELTSFIEDGEVEDDTILYQVNLQLFPISKVIK